VIIDQIDILPIFVVRRYLKNPEEINFFEFLIEKFLIDEKQKIP
jgi:hypothetical protein